ncbi:MAG: hypothetical protein HN936_09620 [Bacteroidetes bacterium]|nr:hypothetical protein [Candidatus Neomarinimicrobiota bacterium]MBT4419720.1 hypothetical protein [Candidatus Neomarinimicrobiota bacterium]MBT7093493.1 hypothetical protein [Bacteroidota bacterium]
MSISKEFQPDITAGMLSLIIPGLGQLRHGRFYMGILQLVLSAILWYYWMGWVIHIWSWYDAKRVWVYHND